MRRGSRSTREGLKGYGGKMHEYALITSLSTSDVISTLDPIKGSTVLEPLKFQIGRLTESVGRVLR